MAMMNLDQIRMKQNPILSSLLLGCGQAKNMIGEKLFPRLPQILSGVTIGKMGNEGLQKYDLRRAPGGPTKRVNISYEGITYKVEQYSVEVPIARELVRESEAMNSMGVGANLGISKIAMMTANHILALDYEIEVAGRATLPANYLPGNSISLAGAAKWSATTGTPVTDILAAMEVVRREIGMRPNKAVFSADAWQAFRTNPEVKTYLPDTQTGPCNVEQAKTILNVQSIDSGEAIWKDEDQVSHDVWGNSTILAYVPEIGAGEMMSLAEPAYGFTNVIEGHPFAEQPYWEQSTKSWVFGATFERRPNFGQAGAGFLFLNCK